MVGAREMWNGGYREANTAGASQGVSAATRSGQSSFSGSLRISSRGICFVKSIAVGGRIPSSTALRTILMAHDTLLRCACFRHSSFAMVISRSRASSAVDTPISNCRGGGLYGVFFSNDFRGR